MAIEALTARQRSAFVDALTAAFRSYDDLDLLLQLELNQPITVAAPAGRLRNVALALIGWAETEGCLDALIAGALNQKPNNPKLKAFGYEILLNAPASQSARLEAIVAPHVPMQDPARWRADMERLERSVCRIEMPEGQPAGSGFLIADDFVMTNFHVAAELAARHASPAECVARFGYRLSAQGQEEEGEAIGFAADWLADSSPVAALDFAVVRLAANPGRPHVPPPRPYRYQEGDIYFILQHPLGVEMKLSAGVFDRLDAGSNRVSYTANTSAGSSGSPVFDVVWAPVALHHAGKEACNTGVVLDAVGRSGKVPELWKPPA